MRKLSALEEDLFTLAEKLGVGTEDSDVCLRAIRKIQSLDGEIVDLTAKNSDMSWRLNPDRMGGSFSDWETNRRGDEWS